MATPNLPSNDFDRTEAFYGSLGFETRYRDQGWMILKRGDLIIEFFPMKIDPTESWFSVCFRVDDLDKLRADFAKAPVPEELKPAMRFGNIKTEPHGIRLFYLSDPDGSLIRAIDNTYES
ncbi:MAG: bleomycin resistance protein [Ponticaulis sp.]|nr:bleomycin resistance protein [Ponticaulis sp.]